MAAPSRDDARTPPEPPAEFGRWSFWRRWFGQRSERAAARYLRKHGYRILAANVADAEGEIDLLALDGGTLVVVEVRSRSVEDPGVAAATVNYPKQRKLTEATLRFLSRRGMLGTTVRFDVLAIAWPPGAREPTVRHIPHAFEATGRFQMYN
jgi:putative endonuclease